MLTYRVFLKDGRETEIKAAEVKTDGGFLKFLNTKGEIVGLYLLSEIAGYQKVEEHGTGTVV